MPFLIDPSGYGYDFVAPRPERPPRIGTTPIPESIELPSVVWPRLDLPLASAHCHQGLHGHSAVIRRCEITEELALRMDKLAGAESWRVFEPGPYLVLDVDGKVMMTECLAERETCEEVVIAARGDVLIAGLGLGMILPPILAKPEVTSVTVLEISPLVMLLVAPHYQSARLQIIEADAFEWEPPQSYDCIWFDIWPHRLESNRQDMARLHARYRHHLRRGGWMRSWVQDQLKIKRLFRMSRAASFVKKLSREQRKLLARDFARMEAMGALSAELATEE